MIHVRQNLIAWLFAPQGGRRGNRNVTQATVPWPIGVAELSACTCVQQNAIHIPMTKHLIAVRLHPDVIDAMRAYKEARLVPVTAQVETALRAWLKAEGFPVGHRPVRKARKAR